MLTSRKAWLTGIAVFSLALLSTSCRKPDPLTEADYNYWYAGGSQTVFDAGGGAYSHPFPGMSNSAMQIHETGDLAFEATFVAAPSAIHPGLGPVFNNVSCASCHIADGRGKPPGTGEPLSSLLLRVSIPGWDEHGGPLAAPGFGGQLQQKAVSGITPESGVNWVWTETAGSFPDGESYNLRQPAIALTSPYTTLPADIMLSPRMAPPVFGLGLLEALDEAEILLNEDEDDKDMDGISGKANYCWDVPSQSTRLGRFGWKASNPSLLQQTAGAYNQDMGITSFIFPQESCEGQEQHDFRDDETEVSDSLLYAVAFYVRTLAVPAARNQDKEEINEGRMLFAQAGCAGCHRPMMRTGVNPAFPQISNQMIFPYSDMLLHDMGPGLADNRPDYLANGQEWRTQPLWGIGLSPVVNGHSYFLHDGRARDVQEAILWHGGEAQGARDYFVQLSQAERDKLIAFVKSL